MALVEHRLSAEAKQLLDLPAGAATEAQWYHRIARSLTSLIAIIDPQPGPRRQLLTKDELAEVLAARDPDVSRCKMQRLDWVCNQIVEASIRVQPRRLRRKWRGNACVDATVVPAWGRRGTSKRSDYVGIEYDTAWYVREGDHRDRSDIPGQKNVKKVHWGWEATLVVMTANDPEREADFPLLVTGISFDKPGHAVAHNALKVFTSIRERGHPAGDVAGDLAYFPNSRPEALQLPLRALGYRIISDYKIDQLGVKEQYAGALQVEGRFYCPAMPQPLIEATIDYRATKPPISKSTWEARIEQRRAYALRPKERPDADGSVPMMCPAAGPNPTVLCPLKPRAATRQHARALPVAVIHNPPAEPGRICTNKSSVTFPATAGAKYGQDMHFGSAEWRNAYSVPRNTIESANGYLKDSGHEKLDDPGRRRVCGQGGS